MIWAIDDIRALVAATLPAGEPDQAAIDAYLAANRHPRQHAPVREGVKRWYYLLADDQRVTICAVWMPLDAWRGGAMAMVGTRQIIGEFAGNRHLVGRKGLQIKLQPIAWLKAPADEHYATSSQALEAISFQILDLDRIAASQAKTAAKYRWRK